MNARANLPRLAELRNRSSFVRVALIVALAVLAALVGHEPAALRLKNPVDLRAFRCASVVAIEHRDPYLVQPLRACELASEREARLESFARFTVMPVPLPPYAFAFYAPFAAMTYGSACVVFSIASIVAAIALALALARATGVPAAIVVPTTLVGIWLPSVFQGQPTIFVALALVVAALAARMNATFATACGLVVSSVSPHLALPASIALATTRHRVAVAVAAFVLATATLAFGLPLAVEYVARAAPAHAVSELRWFGGQFSPAAALVAFGFAPHVARSIDDIAWAAATTAATILARRLARMADDPAYLALVTPALALPFAPFLHATWIGLALPGALLLVTRAPRARTIAGLAIALLAIPWNDALSALPFFAGPTSVRFTETAAPTDLASNAWRALIDARASAEFRPAWLLALVKLPTWIGFALLWSVAIRVAFPARGDAPARKRAFKSDIDRDDGLRRSAR